MKSSGIIQTKTSPLTLWVYSVPQYAWCQPLPSTFLRPVSLLFTTAWTREANTPVFRDSYVPLPISSLEWWMYTGTPSSMWILGIWTQARTLVGQVLYPLDHLPHYTLTSPTLTGLLFNGSSINGSLIKILWKLLFSSFYIYLLCVCVRTLQVWRPENKLQELVLPFYCVILGTEFRFTSFEPTCDSFIFKISLQNNRFPSGVLTPSSFLLILTPHTHPVSASSTTVPVWPQYY